MDWFSFDEVEPENNVPILVSDGENVWSAIFDRNGETVYFFCHGYGGHEIEPEFGKPLYWAELPKPPSKLTPLVLDGGDSAAQQALFTPEVLSTLQGESKQTVSLLENYVSK